LAGVAVLAGEACAPDSSTPHVTVESYFVALHRGCYEKAYQLWHGGVKVGGLTVSPQQFAALLADTELVDFAVGAPVAAQVGAEALVPVAVVKREGDGRLFLIAGCYNLVPEAGVESLRWAITWADMTQDAIYTSPPVEELAAVANSRVCEW